MRTAAMSAIALFCLASTASAHPGHDQGLHHVPEIAAVTVLGLVGVALLFRVVRRNRAD